MKPAMGLNSSEELVHEKVDRGLFRLFFLFAV